MPTFLIVVLLIYGAMHAYAFARLLAVFPSRTLSFVLIVAGLALTFSPLLVWGVERRGWHGATLVAAWLSYTWMVYLFLFVCVALAFDLAHGATALLHVHWPFGGAKGLTGISLLALAFLGYGFYEARQIRVERVTLQTPKMHGQVTLVQLSDMHLGAIRRTRFLKRVMRQVATLQPDIVVATGDIVDGQGERLGDLVPYFRAYTPPLGAYAVTGNHESYAGLDNSLAFLRRAGFRMLHGEVARVGPLVLVGLDDPAASPHPQRMLRKDDLPDRAFVVLLKHQPIIDQTVPFDLQLSGHVHGGQIFPFVYLTQRAYGVSTGYTALGDGRVLYVSRGAGTWGPPVRLFAPPEITLITIVGTGKKA